MNDEQNTKREAATDQQGRLDALVMQYIEALTATYGRGPDGDRSRTDDGKPYISFSIGISVPDYADAKEVERLKFHALVLLMQDISAYVERKRGIVHWRKLPSIMEGDNGNLYWRARLVA